MVSPSLLPRTTRVGEMFIDEVISNYKERRKHDIDWVQSVQKVTYYGRQDSPSIKYVKYQI